MAYSRHEHWRLEVSRLSAVGRVGYGRKKRQKGQAVKGLYGVCRTACLDYSCWYLVAYFRPNMICIRQVSEMVLPLAKISKMTLFAASGETVNLAKSQSMYPSRICRSRYRNRRNDERCLFLNPLLCVHLLSIMGQPIK